MVTFHPTVGKYRQKGWKRDSNYDTIMKVALIGARKLVAAGSVAMKDKNVKGD